ncbi:hypothetical protein TcWFU_000791 [Taenia crassiceps]|uniref:Gelsolin-like domain-containing protein n=1 Tax=Taenia crassiceps TaxID=6207 RepID=A0ABR4QNL2_9CEST
MVECASKTDLFRDNQVFHIRFHDLKICSTGTVLHLKALIMILDHSYFFWVGDSTNQFSAFRAATDQYMPLLSIVRTHYRHRPEALQGQPWPIVCRNA